MQSSLPMHLSPRCRATSKRSGKRCQAPAVRGKAVCRIHGAGGGAPAGNRNAFKHGGYTAEAIEERRLIAELIRERPRTDRDGLKMRGGRHLKAARTLAAMTQRKLAEAAGIHPNAVKYWERQSGRIGGNAVSRMRDALSVAGVTAGEEHDGHRSVAVLRG